MEISIKVLEMNKNKVAKLWELKNSDGRYILNSDYIEHVRKVCGVRPLHTYDDFMLKTATAGILSFSELSELSEKVESGEISLSVDYSEAETVNSVHF